MSKQYGYSIWLISRGHFLHLDWTQILNVYFYLLVYLFLEKELQMEICVGQRTEGYLLRKYS